MEKHKLIQSIRYDGDTPIYFEKWDDDNVTMFCELCGTREMLNNTEDRKDFYKKHRECR